MPPCTRSHAHGRVDTFMHILRDRSPDRHGVTEGHSLPPRGGLRGPVTCNRRKHPFWSQTICRKMLRRRYRCPHHTHRAPWQPPPAASLVGSWPWAQELPESHQSPGSWEVLSGCCAPGSCGYLQVISEHEAGQ